MDVYFLYVFILSLKYRRKRAPQKLSKANLPCRPFFRLVILVIAVTFVIILFLFLAHLANHLSSMHETFSRLINKILKGFILTLGEEQGV